MMSNLKYVVPNAFTGLSMLLGVASITQSVDGNYTLAAWMILWGALLDKLDGTAARLLRASSSFGMQFDSFADFIVFGMAPAALWFYRLRSLGYGSGAAGMLLVASCALYILATSGRLARFNISEPPMSDRLFYGIPTTVWGAVLGTWYLTWDKYQLSPQFMRAMPFVLIAAAALMVSNVRLPKLKPRKNLAFNVFQFANVGTAYIFGPLMLFPEYLFFCALLYPTGGVIYYLISPPTEDVDEDAESDTDEAHAA